ncbi:MAG TPA: NAD(P)-dependent oxidoreductase [Chlamydiales bacterium]|nr:MAG: nucleoside-diphosphate sugar epimerase [Verrucomicrobia bacterium RIFCSPHIGHO2_12_FULL_41_10]HLB52590.1 NAD(P)-dependent oxidoreductase [Chlamydiales bacterium]
MAKDLIIVTGSCGRIGTALIRKFGDTYSVVGFELLKAIYASGNEELVPVDLSSDESVAQAFRHIRSFYGNRIAAVIHLAAYYSFSDKESDKYELITVKGTERLLKELQNFEVEQFIFTSTMLIYAPTRPGVPIKEDSPIHATWGYPASKVRTEALIHNMRGKIPTVMLRVAGVYDDLCHSIPISHQIQRIYENQLDAHFFAGDQTHGASFIHMDDLVDAIATAVNKRKELPQETVLLLGEPKTLSYATLQTMISKLLFNKKITTFSLPKWFAKIGSWLQCLIFFKHKPFIRPWMIDLADDHYELDISKAKSVLNWEPRHSLEESLPVMIDALKKDKAKWYKVNQLEHK